MKKFFITIFFIVCAFTSISAQIIKTNVYLDSTSILIGDQIILHIEVEHQKDVQVAFPLWKDKLTENIEIIDIFPFDSTAIGEDKVRLKQELLITSFDSGRHELPPIHFPFVSALGADTIKSAIIYLDVSTMPLDGTDEITDIKPIYELPIDWSDIWPWLLIILSILLGVALVGFGIYAFVRWRQNKPIFGPPKPLEPPHTVALRELDRLRAEKLWQNNRAKEYHTRLSDIVRTYIAGRFYVPAMEMTSDEILGGLLDTGFNDNSMMERLSKMFVLSDLVKFAKAEPMPDENESALLDCYVFVNNTKIEVIIDNIEEKNKDDTINEQ